MNLRLLLIIILILVLYILIHKNITKGRVNIDNINVPHLKTPSLDKLSLIGKGKSAKAYISQQGTIIKKFGDPLKFEHELYHLNKMKECNFVPSLISANKKEKIIEQSYCGLIVTLDTLPSDYIEQIDDINHVLTKQGMKYPDAHPWNWTVMDGKLYLIDWGHNPESTREVYPNAKYLYNRLKKEDVYFMKYRDKKQKVLDYIKNEF